MEQNNPFNTNPNSNPNPNQITTDNGKTAGIISYFTIIGWLIAYFAMHKDNRTELGSFQLRQTLLFNIAAIVIGWGLGFVLGIAVMATGIYSLVYLLYIVQIGMFVIWIVGLIGAINGEKKPMPLIGEMAQTTFSSI
ncbi:hypothetical protein EZJ43_16155 [Pedobacter changchengzhani]|uniref:DUF4870 domain-containing protein n=1 Tax=Pedobacter changchengzhani TaxID=2529274 RepID=A0A4R5MH95_9SPHI|nr:hypothetical protein [Pedobacter changchengzhani]TDG34888.1 hypothetical protein EZJ43_16155 [Pedobacter changchengzhani]